MPCTPVYLPQLHGTRVHYRYAPESSSGLYLSHYICGREKGKKKQTIEDKIHKKREREKQKNGMDQITRINALCYCFKMFGIFLSCPYFDLNSCESCCILSSPESIPPNRVPSHLTSKQLSRYHSNKMCAWICI